MSLPSKKTKFSLVIFDQTKFLGGEKKKKFHPLVSRITGTKTNDSGR